jgi:hypothetical protein
MVKRLYASTVLEDKPDTGAEFCVVDAADYDRLEQRYVDFVRAIGNALIETKLLQKTAPC